MSVYGDYAAQIIHDQRSRDLEVERQRDRLVREAKCSQSGGRGGAGRGGAWRAVRRAVGFRPPCPDVA